MDNPLLLQTRRHFFKGCSIGLGAMALGSLLDNNSLSGSEKQADSYGGPQVPRKPHFPAKAKSVVFLFMAGGPSQLELFDYKPKLQELNGQPIPESFIKNKRFAFMDLFTKEVPKLLGTKRRFAKHGQCGACVSECLPHLAGVVDDIAFVLSVAADVLNQHPAKLCVNCSCPQLARPSMAAWSS